MRALNWISKNYSLLMAHLNHLVEDTTYPSAERALTSCTSSSSCQPTNSSLRFLFLVVVIRALVLPRHD